MHCSDAAHRQVVADGFRVARWGDDQHRASRQALQYLRGVAERGRGTGIQFQVVDDAGRQRPRRRDLPGEDEALLHQQCHGLGHCLVRKVRRFGEVADRAAAVHRRRDWQQESQGVPSADPLAYLSGREDDLAVGGGDRHPSAQPGPETACCEGTIGARHE